MTAKEGLETVGFQDKLEAWSLLAPTTTYMIHTTTSSFLSNTANHCLSTRFRSLFVRLLRKSLSAMTSNLNNWAMTKTTSIFLLHFLPNTVVPMWFASSNPLLLVNSSSDFLSSRKNSGEASSGLTAFTLLRLASGGIGKWSNNMLQTKERRWSNHSNSDYLLKAMQQAIPCGLPQGV